MWPANLPQIRMPPIKVAIVEDNREIREGLAFFIGSSSGFDCVSACGSAEEALRELPRFELDVVLMDIGLPGMSGIECIQALKRLLPETQIMMLTIFEEPQLIFDSLAAGATGYLLKKTPPDRLLELIKELREGGSPISSQIARRVIQAFQKPPPKPDPTAGLTVREKEILDHLARGMLYKEIAATLGISSETVRTHVRNIYEKLHVRTRTEALNKVRQ
jgi:DNA-binding NarL/FixJ family response regulator